MLANTDKKKPNQALLAHIGSWSNRLVFESWNELGSVGAMTARCWALGPSCWSLSQLENALQNLSAPFSPDKLFYCSYTVGFHLVFWLMIGWEHVHYCCSFPSIFLQHGYSDWKCSHLIARFHATKTKQKHTRRRFNVHWWCTEWGTALLPVAWVALSVHRPGNASTRNNFFYDLPSASSKTFNHIIQCFMYQD